EKAQAEFDENEAEAMAAKMRENTYDFNDFIKNMDQMNKMGSMKDILKMIPGMNKMGNLDDLNVDPKQMAQTRAMIQSMTPFERENPDSISQSRRRRIAKGSATTLQEVNRLIKQFNESRKLMSAMSNGNMGALQNMMGGLGGGGFGGFGGGGNRNKNRVAELQAKQMARKLKKAKKKGK
ncbi:MAG TPA: signal recognition particle protein, partial [Aerococcus urinaeequi]|nr:signal recognition particle protein [Aerococcus urinaeequi]